MSSIKFDCETGWVIDPSALEFSESWRLSWPLVIQPYKSQPSDEEPRKKRRVRHQKAHEEFNEYCRSTWSKFLDKAYKDLVLESGIFSKVAAGTSIDGTKPLVNEINIPELLAIPHPRPPSALKLNPGKVMKIDDPKSVLQRVVYNNGDSPACLKINESFFLVPGRSSFYISDLLSTDFAPIQSLGPFNVVVADPPWPNKSATRSNAYGVLDHHELYRIPFREFVAPGGVLAIWVVNRMKVIHFVKTKLFPSLGVDLVEEIAWIKVTSSGEWVFSPQSLDRKPYEFLLVGRRRIGEESSKEEPQRKAIAAIPSVHSRKPILEGILERHVEFDPADSSAPNRAIKKLELFARCLLPNWTSWGNEPLRFSSDAYLVYSKEL